jgi:steroid delta-isomerase-like uncharacterized protein
MSTAENKVIALRFIQAWSSGGLKVLDELADPNIVVKYSHFEEPVVGLANFKKMLSMTHASFPDIEVTVDRVIVENDQAVVHWSYTATHQVEVYNVPPTGNTIEVIGVTIYRIENGKVVEEMGVVDNLAMYKQIGLLPSE